MFTKSGYRYYAAAAFEHPRSQLTGNGRIEVSRYREPSQH